jgi:hypothetical protein
MNSAGSTISTIKPTSAPESNNIRRMLYLNSVL